MARLANIVGRLVRGVSGAKPPRPPGPRGDEKPSRPSIASWDSDFAGTVVEYNPSLDGDADPGEVVWTWVPYEDDPSAGKDRPVLVIGRQGPDLAALALTSKDHSEDPGCLKLGSGPWDAAGRVSFVKLDQVLRLHPAAVRREGARLDRDRFDRVVASLRRTRRSRR
jgi:hypothetical protein